MNPGLKRTRRLALSPRRERACRRCWRSCSSPSCCQIFFRYVMNWPTGWTNELSAILWIWIVLWGAAFVLTEQEEMRFDLIYASVGPRARSAMFLVSAASLIFLYAISFPAVFDYVTFMKVEKHRLSQAALRLAVFDLRHFRHRHDRSLPVAVAGRFCADRRRKSSTRPRQDPAYEHREPLFRSRSSRSPRWRCSGCRSAMR